MTSAWQTLKQNSWIRWAAIALVAVILLTVFAAPQTVQRSGSTYGRTPDGYGAWYAAMAEQGTPVERSRLPFADWSASAQHNTLLRIYGRFEPLSVSEAEQQWIERGNTLIVLGVAASVTEAPFNSRLPSNVGDVAIATRRRLKPQMGDKPLLSDRYGAVVLQRPLRAGQLILSVTPHLAANAYQEESGNFAFLTELSTQGDRQPWVDEYLHGYRDPTSTTAEVEQSWVRYLANTPVLPIMAQLAVLLLVVVWAENQRFGAPLEVRSPPVNNSRTYINAMAGVLQKANCQDFVVNTIGKYEQSRIQRSLGLGTAPVTPETLLTAWAAQTGRPAQELEQAFAPYWNPQQTATLDLSIWLPRLHALYHHLPS